MRWLCWQRWLFARQPHWSRFLSIGLLVGLFGAIVFSGQPVLAADVTWNGQALVYKDDSYSLNTDASLPAKLGLDSGGKLYTLKSGSGNNQQLQVLYFSAGADIATADQVDYLVYNFTPPDNYSEKSTARVSLEPAGEHSEVFTTECGVESIGWFVCPITTSLAKGMDWMYDKLDGFLASQPLNVTDTNSGMYQTWRVMLGFANAAFIVGFLVVIYSQITSLGISNYNIKKMLPRLVIAAILVNLSYYICAVVIDLSNISGHALQDLFIQICQ